MILGKVYAYLDGSLIRSQEMRSFLKNFAVLVYSHFKDTPNTYVLIDGSQTSFYPNDKAFPINEMPVGSSNQPVTSTDYNLVSTIASGSGDGLLYYASPVISTVYDSLNGFPAIDIINSYTNEGTIDVIVGEVGVISYVVNNSSYKTMIIRDTFDPVITVQPGKTLTLKYTLEFVV